MGYLKYIKKAFQKPSSEQKKLQTERLISFRKDSVTVRVDRPTRMDRARSIGYRAKQGIIIIRQRVGRGSHVRGMPDKGRRSKRYHNRKDLSKNYQQIAEERAARKYGNCEVLGSYLAARDGQHQWFEVILVDRAHPQVIHDKKLIGIAAQKGRAARGLTSAGRKARGLRKKGAGVEKNRPSLRSKKRHH